jgi:hypothetical protein
MAASNNSNWWHYGKIINQDHLERADGWWPNTHLELNPISPFIHWITGHHFYEDFCRKQMPELLTDD